MFKMIQKHFDSIVRPVKSLKMIKMREPNARMKFEVRATEKRMPQCSVRFCATEEKFFTSFSKMEKTENNRRRPFYVF